MPASARPFGSFVLGLGRGQFDFDADTFGVLLTASGYLPAYDTDQFVDDVTNELDTSGTGYTRKTLTDVTWGATGSVSTFTAADVVWASLTATVRRVIVFKDTGNDATSRLMFGFDFGTDKIRDAEPLELRFTSGLFAATVIATY